jgi:hypothetical protein
MKQIYLLLLTCILLGSSCGSQGDNYEQIAEEACNCMQPLSGLYSELKAAIDNNDLDALDGLADEIEEANDAVDSCAEGVEEKYGELEGSKGEAVRLAMKSKCPEIIQIMNEVEQQLVK